MERRNFLKNGLAAGAASIVSTPLWARNEAPQPAGAAAAGQPFQLNYAFHDGMFKNHGGADFVDQIKWAHDQGFRGIEDNGMMGRSVEQQTKIGETLAKLGKDHGEIFDHHYVEFHYADGSILNSQCRHQPKTMAKVDELLVGTKGKIQCGAANLIDHKGKVLYQFDKKSENNPYQSEHDELFAAIAKGEYKFADAENGAYSTMTSILGRMATYSGQVVEWNKALNSGISLQPKAYAWDAMPSVVPNADGFYPVAVPGVTKFNLA